MVLKPQAIQPVKNTLFENDVNMYGTQTSKLYKLAESGFENDVNMYGTQTSSSHHNILQCLRMM